jgi:hypothetical protein
MLLVAKSQDACIIGVTPVEILILTTGRLIVRLCTNIHTINIDNNINNDSNNDNINSNNCEYTISRNNQFFGPSRHQLFELLTLHLCPLLRKSHNQFFNQFRSW